jgi:formylglycine-generating enzyme required for sulfatase activity
MMGSPKGEQKRRDDEGPQHVVTISRPIAVGKLLVTVERFAAFSEGSSVSARTLSVYFGPG